jgi:hypothetical protein
MMVRLTLAVMGCACAVLGACAPRVQTISIHSPVFDAVYAPDRSNLQDISSTSINQAHHEMLELLLSRGARSGLDRAVSHFENMRANPKWAADPHLASASIMAGYCQLMRIQPLPAAGSGKRTAWFLDYANLLDAAHYYLQPRAVAGIDSYWWDLGEQALQVMEVAHGQPEAYIDYIAANRLLKVDYVQTKDVSYMKDAARRFAQMAARVPELAERLRVPQVQQSLAREIARLERPAEVAPPVVASAARPIAPRTAPPVGVAQPAAPLPVTVPAERPAPPPTAPVGEILSVAREPDGRISVQVRCTSPLGERVIAAHLYYAKGSEGVSQQGAELIPADLGTARLSLPPGEYRLWVRAIDARGRRTPVPSTGGGMLIRIDRDTVVRP